MTVSFVGTRSSWPVLHVEVLRSCQTGTAVAAAASRFQGTDVQKSSSSIFNLHHPTPAQEVYLVLSWLKVPGGFTQDSYTCINTSTCIFRIAFRDGFDMIRNEYQRDVFIPWEIRNVMRSCETYTFPIGPLLALLYSLCFLLLSMVTRREVTQLRQMCEYACRVDWLDDITGKSNDPIWSNLSVSWLEAALLWPVFVCWWGGPSCEMHSFWISS